MAESEQPMAPSRGCQRGAHSRTRDWEPQESGVQDRQTHTSEGLCASPANDVAHSYKSLNGSTSRQLLSNNKYQQTRLLLPQPSCAVILSQATVLLRARVSLPLRGCWIESLLWVSTRMNWQREIGQSLNLLTTH